MENDAKACAKILLEIRVELLRAMKYEGMLHDEFILNLYHKTSEVLFAASRLVAEEK